MLFGWVLFLGVYGDPAASVLTVFAKYDNLKTSNVSIVKH